jgi:hypothetical protein
MPVPAAFDATREGARLFLHDVFATMAEDL